MNVADSSTAAKLGMVGGLDGREDIRARERTDTTTPCMV